MQRVRSPGSIVAFAGRQAFAKSAKIGLVRHLGILEFLRCISYVSYGLVRHASRRRGCC